VRLRSGAIAGLGSVVVFTWVHDLFISDIWAMLPVMAVAGVVCGVCLTWSYRALVPGPSLRSWAGYVGAFIAMFWLLAVASVAVFEPVTTMAEVSAAGGPIDHLFGRAMPLSIGFVLGFSLFLVWRFGEGWAGLGPALVASAVLMLFLGMNVSAVGLVDIPTDGWYLVAELLGLIAALGAVFGVAVVLIDPPRAADPVGTAARSATSQLP
jgi:hypothetical protein